VWRHNKPKTKNQVTMKERKKEERRKQKASLKKMGMN